MSFPNRVAARASEVKFSRAVLTVVAFPFFVLGLLLGLLWVALVWVCLAVVDGISVAQGRDEAAGAKD